MFKKVIKYFIIIFISIFFFFISYLIYSSDLRRNFLTYSVAGYKFYQKILIKNSLPDIKKASDQLLRFIKITNYLSSEGKNNFLISIYENAEIIEDKITKKEDYLYFSDIIRIIQNKDPNLYNANLWTLKSAIYKKEDTNKISNLIDLAIKLAPAREEAYRYGLNYYADTKKINQFNKLCKKYHNLNLGGVAPKYVQSNFYGFSFSKFALETLPSNKKELYYIQEGISFNAIENYIFSLKKPKKINGLNLYTGFLLGSKIQILSIEVLNTDNERIFIPLEDVYINSKNSYFELENEKINILGFKEKNEKITINFKNFYNSISQIILKTKFSRLQLTNKPNC